MAKHRSLWPREHGAYAQLAAPLAAALVIRTPTVAAALLAVAAACAFLTNEPLLVVLGHRGPRARDAEGARARRLLVPLIAATAVVGVAGFALAGREVLGVGALAAIPAVAVIALAVRRAQHSLAGEVIAAIALPGAGAPVAVASGVPVGEAVILWAAWSAGFVASVLAVHRVIANHRRPAARAPDHDVAAIDRWLAVALLGAVAVAIAIPEPIAVVAVPLLAASAALVIRPPPASRLRAIGVGLVVASIAALATAVAVVS